MDYFLRVLVFISTFLLLKPTSEVCAQPFDTLLQQFHSISEIYPLADGTFILIGEGNDVRVKRINQHAEIIWSSVLYSNILVDIIRSKVHVLETDSSIQVMTAKRDCDIYDGEHAVIYTLSFSGEILDSLFVPYHYHPPYVALLSGNPERPALAYIEEKEVIFSYHNGDTFHLKLTFSHADTTNSYLIGNPYKVAMCPDGMIVIGAEGLYTFKYTANNGQYKVRTFVLGTPWQASDLLCLDNHTFLYVHGRHITRWQSDLPVQSYSTREGSYIQDVVWRDPYLAVRESSFTADDSIYFLDHLLKEVHRESRGLPYIQFKTATAIYDNISYYVGYGYKYNDGGFLASLSHETLEGPKYDDVLLEGFEIDEFTHTSPVDTCSYLRSNHNYSGMNVTFTNQGDNVITSVDVNYQFEVGCCKPDSWTRTLTGLDLQPGESQTHYIPDIHLTRFNFPENQIDCIYLSRPNNRHDDYPEDNEICREVVVSTLAPHLAEIQIFPNPVADQLNIQSIDFDDYQIRIMDIDGRELIYHSSASHTMDVEHLPGGIYVIQIHFPDGNYFTQKILKL